MSQVATRSPPAAPREDEPRQHDSLDVPQVEGSGPVSTGEPVAFRGESLLDTLTVLVQEVHTATDLKKPGMVGAINALLARLPSEVDAGAASAVLQRLLAAGRLEGLADEEGQFANIAATQTLLDLGYPHALEVTPEQLEALRRWRPTTPPVPWFNISVTLFFAFVAQIFFASSGPDYHPMMAELLANGTRRFAERTWLEDFVRSTSALVTAGQFWSNFAAFILSVAAGWHYRGRRLARRVFFGLGVLGLLVGSLQLTASVWLTWTTFASAAGSLVSGWLLKRR
jgi:hypothetical protein